MFGCPAGTLSLALKAWPQEQYVALMAHLRATHDLPVLLAGHEAEAPALEEIRDAAEAQGVRSRLWTGGASGLGTLLGLIALSRVYVGNDTGPMHLAGAVGVPVVARFGGGHWPRFTPLARRAFSATQQLPCAGCGWHCWLDDAACLKLIETQTLIDGIDWVLSGSGAEQRLHGGRVLEQAWSDTFIAARSIRYRLEADLADMTAHATARLDQVHELTRAVNALRRRRLRLAVNLCTLQPDKIGGLEEAFRQVMDRLIARHGGELDVTLLTSTANAHAFGEWRDAVRSVQLPDEGWEDALAQSLRRADVLWCPLFFLEPLPPDVPSVVTIPDLQHDTFPEFFPPDLLALRLQQCRMATAYASRVVTLSEYSRREILQRYGGREEYVTAIHLDAGAAFRRPADPERIVTVRERYGLPERYGLFPANSWPHKNHRGLLRAIARYRDRYGDPPLLVLTGAAGVGGIDLATAIAETGVGDLVRHLGYVDRDELPDLYDGAAFLAFVSLYEGFGIPVVEAFRRGTPVIVGPPDASLRYGMDYDLWIRLSRHFRVDYLERFLATSRMHAENKTLGERDGVFREVMAVAQRHYGAVHTNWIAGYVNYQMSCDPPIAQLPARAQRQRAAILDGRVRSEVNAALHDDGWAGRRTVVTVDSDDTGRVTIECDCPVWPHLDGLKVIVSCDGRVLAEHDVQGPDTFVLAFQLPSQTRSRVAVLLEASAEVIPLVRELSDEARSLSFRVSSAVVAADGTLRAASDRRAIGQALELCPTSLDDCRMREAAVHADGWAGPEVQVRCALPETGDLLHLTGVHDEGLASIGGPLTLWAFVNDRPLGPATTHAAGPFTMCWRVPAEVVEALRVEASPQRPLPLARSSAQCVTTDRGPGACHVTIVSATSVVPSRFWPSDDQRALAFRFGDLGFHPTVPPGATIGREASGSSRDVDRQPATELSLVRPGRLAIGTRVGRRLAGMLRRGYLRQHPLQ